jgi:hypothetical protein
LILKKKLFIVKAHFDVSNVFLQIVRSNFHDKCRQDSFTCRSLPNLTERRNRNVGDKTSVWGQFHFVAASRASTFNGLVGGGDIASMKTISFVDLDDDDRKPIDKYGDDDDKVN